MKENQVVLYSPVINSRREYIFQFIFTDILGLDLKIEPDKHSLSIGNEIIINYSPEIIQGAIQYAPHGLLDETGISNKDPHFGSWNSFIGGDVESKSSLDGFDPFAFCFYLLTRYEEYIPHDKDRFGRYKSENSMGHKEGFIKRPIIELCALEIARNIKSVYPSFQFPDKEPKIQFTVDIDNAFAYRGKGMIRMLGGFIRSIMQLNWPDVVSRFKFHTGNGQDPYDTYDYLIEKLEPLASESVAFFLVGNYGKLDKNVPFQHPSFEKLLHKVSSKLEIGLHPSVGSSGNKENLMMEKDRLSSIIDAPVTKSRQHYLLLNFPETYKALIDIGIEEDYSMGYPDCLGFRAGTSHPHRFFDLSENRATQLIIHPFVAMDVTLKNYLGLNPEQAIHELKGMMDEIEMVGGTCEMIWHNESLSNKGEWRGWKKVFEEAVNRCNKNT